MKRNFNKYLLPKVLIFQRPKLKIPPKSMIPLNQGGGG